MSKEKTGGFFKKLINYFKETKGELKKVTWPTKKQVINNTIVVLVFILVVGICIWSVDFLMGILMNFIFSKV